MQVLRQWLYDIPQEMWQMMWQNPTYISSRNECGPYGRRSCAYFERSIAVDKNYIRWDAGVCGYDSAGQ